MSVDLDVVRKDLHAACPEVRQGNAADTGGAVPALVALPGSTAEAAAVMRVAAEHELAVVPRGGGSRLWWGHPASRCDLAIDLSRMTDVVEHSHGDLVARAQAGARIADVQAALATAGQEIALDVPGDATIGGVVASGLAGPRRLRYGTPRDLLIGITIVRADGTVAKSGGKVVKNVAGYDLGKLFAGSWGTLGLITEATFRLHPLPAARAYVTARYAATAALADAVAAAANSPLVPSAVEVYRRSGEQAEVGVLLEGSADGVAARAARMADLLATGAVSPDPPHWWPGTGPGEPRRGAGEPRIQVSCWVSALGRVLDAIDGAAAAAGIEAGISGSGGAGVLDVAIGPWSADEPPDDARARPVAEFVGRLRESLDGRRGKVVVLAAPAPVRAALADCGGMHGTVPGLALMRAVRDQFDPGHRMSPGRFPEGT